MRKIDRIRALDSKYTGEEPVWQGWEEWPVEKFWREKNRAFTFYNYYTKSGQLKPAVLDWMEANGYDELQVRMIKDAPDYIPGATVCTLCHCLNRGMPDQHPKLAEYLEGFSLSLDDARSVSEFVRSNLEQSLIDAVRIAREKKEDEARFLAQTGQEKAETPVDKLRKKVQNTIFQELDELVDDWVRCPLDQPIRELSPYERMNHHSLPEMAVKMVMARLIKARDEMTHAITGEDEYLEESYSVYPRPRLKEMITATVKMIADLSRFKHAKKAERTPRQKKTKSAEKQVERLKYLKHSEEHKITSVQPVKIPGAYQLWVFNVKYRTLAMYVAASAQGLQVQGTSIKNFDPKQSLIRTLRKPEVVLPMILEKTRDKAEKEFAALTTTAREPNGRVNEECILLRVVDSR